MFLFIIVSVIFRRYYRSLFFILIQSNTPSKVTKSINNNSEVYSMKIEAKQLH